MRTAPLRAALLVLALGACAGRVAATAGAAPVPAGSDPEDDRTHMRADALRSRILTSAGWADFGDDKCNPGSLRTYPSDTTKGGVGAVQQDIEGLEALILARGLDNPIDTPEGHALLGVLVSWEAGASRPGWDVASGQKTRQAIAAGLTGEYSNPATNLCQSYVKLDSITIVVPEVTRFTPPKTGKVRTAVLVSDTALARARRAFFDVPHQRDASFNFSRVRALVLWRDYAVAAVNRRAQLEGVTIGDQSGGAAYVFHRVGREWRLLTITRTWG